MKNQALELHSPLPKSFKVCKERTMEKRKSKQSEEKQRGQQLQSSFALLKHFSKSIFYILYTISKLRKSNASNRVRFGAEMRKIWPSEANCSRLCEIRITPSKFA
ncbi:hypothetical protein VitviT2T_019787 [Vitis vinifera]|uniref:Uncharacterized protein n=1 Tax=Vitis vinifera TaxID=29760 RepID=A0ABY9D227_VITVI|nr:hypothetical protein VitviT2T_019787 [Vitis vinifera]